MKDIAATWKLYCEHAVFFADMLFARSPPNYAVLAEIQVRAYCDRTQPESADELELRIAQLTRLFEILTTISTCRSTSSIFPKHADQCASIAAAFSDSVTADSDAAIDITAVHHSLASL